MTLVIIVRATVTSDYTLGSHDKLQGGRAKLQGGRAKLQGGRAKLQGGRAKLQGELLSTWMRVVFPYDGRWKAAQASGVMGYLDLDLGLG